MGVKMSATNITSLMFNVIFFNKLLGQTIHNGLVDGRSLRTIPLNDMANNFIIHVNHFIYIIPNQWVHNWHSYD